jgi:hypothetical protein
MELATRDAAAQLGVSQRQVQRLARGGRVASREIAGRKVLAGRSLLAVSRSAGRGRRWDDDTVAAAAELLEIGSTARISGSQRSRLRARLRTISVPELAYQMLGDRVTLWRPAGNAERGRERADGLTTTGGSLDVYVTADSLAYARRSRLIEDADGTLLLVELATGAPSVMTDIVLYAFGDERESSSARGRLQERQAQLR